ncbi:MAG: 2-phosphosulfolactate phosphatase [Anaerolineae bacterium]|nr:2-phosphosulfolactate phosphatase [Anaerolineae bacterium]
MSSKTAYWSQDDFDIRCEWGAQGVATLASVSDVVIIVDVLSFSTAVDIAVSRGAIIYPYHLRNDSAVAYAKSRDALLASFRRDEPGGYSLAPTSLVNIPAGTRLVLPSPNGATLSMGTDAVPTFAGCLRNARAVAQTAQGMGNRISIIPAGERWPDGSLRPSIEDQIGAGAIIHFLEGTRSPEAQVAEQAFLAFQDQLEFMLLQCSSGKELVEQEFFEDVRLAAVLNASASAPFLYDKAYRQHITANHD